MICTAPAVVLLLGLLVGTATCFQAFYLPRSCRRSSERVVVDRDRLSLAVHLLEFARFPLNTSSAPEVAVTIGQHLCWRDNHRGIRRVNPWPSSTHGWDARARCQAALAYPMDENIKLRRLTSVTAFFGCIAGVHRLGVATR